MNWKRIGLVASGLSILGSIGIYAMGEQSLGIFVGLWASAILLLSERLDEEFNWGENLVFKIQNECERRKSMFASFEKSS